MSNQLHKSSWLVVTRHLYNKSSFTRFWISVIFVICIFFKQKPIDMSSLNQTSSNQTLKTFRFLVFGTPLCCCQVKHTPCAPSNLFWRYTVHPLHVSVLENGLHSTTVLVRENFCWQNVKSLLARQNCFILHSPFVRGPLLSSCPSCAHTHPLVPSVYPSEPIHPARRRQKQKEFIREIMFPPSGFSEPGSQKNRHCS